MERYNQIFAVIVDCMKAFIEHNLCDLSAEGIESLSDEFEKDMFSALLSEINRMREAQKNVSGVTFNMDIYKKLLADAYKLFHKYYPLPKDEDWQEIAYYITFFKTLFGGALCSAIVLELERLYNANKNSDAGVA